MFSFNGVLTELADYVASIQNHDPEQSSSAAAQLQRCLHVSNCILNSPGD